MPEATSLLCGLSPPVPWLLGPWGVWSQIGLGQREQSPHRHTQYVSDPHDSRTSPFPKLAWAPVVSTGRCENKLEVPQAGKVRCAFCPILDVSPTGKQPISQRDPLWAAALQSLSSLASGSWCARRSRHSAGDGHSGDWEGAAEPEAPSVTERSGMRRGAGESEGQCVSFVSS